MKRVYAKISSAAGLIVLFQLHAMDQLPKQNNNEGEKLEPSAPLIAQQTPTLPTQPLPSPLYPQVQDKLYQEQINFFDEEQEQEPKKQKEPLYQLQNSIHEPTVIIKVDPSSWNSYEKLKQDVFAYVQGASVTYGDAMLHGAMHEKIGISKKSPPISEVEKYYDWNSKLITLGHHVDRVICEIIQHTLEQNSNTGLGHLFRHTQACDKNQYKISNDTLIYLITALAYRERRKEENHKQFAKIHSNLRMNIAQPSALNVKNLQEVASESKALKQKKSKINPEHLAYIEKILCTATERVKSFATPMAQESRCLPQFVSKLWGEVYRRTLGDESYKENLLNGTLEQCIADYKSCPTYKVKKLFEYLKGEAKESIDKEDIDKVFSMLRSRVTLGHEADRIVRSLILTALKDYQTPKSNTSIEHLNKAVEACNKYGYYLHGYTAKLVANSLDYLSQNEVSANEEFDNIQTKLRTIVSDFQKDEIESDMTLKQTIVEHDKQQQQ
jgi:hypothetical protein